MSAPATFSSMEKDRRFVAALARGLDVLSCFDASNRFLGNTQIAERTGLPKATVSRLTHTLTALGYLKFSGRHNKYELGTAVIGIGYSVLANMEIRRVARPLMQALAEHTHSAVNLGVRDRLNMLYIDTYRTASTYAVQLDIGSQIPLATTSMGRAYLAAQPEAEREALLGDIRRSDAKNWPAIQAGIEQALADLQEKGYCVSLGDWRKEVHAIAVPLIPEDGSEVMVFSCSGASFQLRKEVIEDDIGPRLINLAGNVKAFMVRR